MNSLSSSPKHSSSSKTNQWRYAAVLVFTLLFAVLLFTFFHEAGHALLGLLFGAQITSFSVDFIGMSAHVGLDAAFSPFQQALVSLGGFTLPLTLTIVFLLSAPRRGNFLLEWVKFLTAIVSISSLLAWVVLPWIYLAGGRPADDSITFLSVSGIYPPLVSFAVALIFVGASAVFLNQMEGLNGIRERMHIDPAEIYAPATRQTLIAMVVVFCVVAGLALGLGLATGSTRPKFLSAPTGYTAAVTIHLSEGKLDNQPVYTFALPQPASVSLFFAMHGLTSGPGKIALIGPSGYENIFFAADEKAGGNFTVHPQNLDLQAGQYQILLTFPKDPGQLSIYQKMELK